MIIKQFLCVWVCWGNLYEYVRCNVWQPTSLRLSCSPDHQPRRDANMHKQLYTDQASLKALQNTAKQERYHKQ
jgi:hypothetical protein